MNKQETHKEVGRLLSHLSSLQFEKDVTHVRREDVIVKEMTMFRDRIHAVIDECISFECMEVIKKIANELQENEKKLEEILNPECTRAREQAIESLQKKADSLQQTCQECKKCPATTNYGDLKVCQSCCDRLDREFDEEYR